MTKKTERRELTHEERELAAIVKAAYQKSGFSQAEIGEKLGGISQSAVGQYLNAAIPMNLPIKIGFCLALDIPIRTLVPDFPVSLQLSEDEETLIQAYRNSDETGKALTLGVAERGALYSHYEPK